MSWNYYPQLIMWSSRILSNPWIWHRKLGHAKKQITLAKWSGRKEKMFINRYNKNNAPWSKSFWSFLGRSNKYFLSHLKKCLIRTILKTTLYEHWRGTKPNISYFHLLDTNAWSTIMVWTFLEILIKEVINVFF